MDLKKGIESGGWASVALGAVGTALDGLAGDPDQVKTNSETFKNVATELGSIGADLTTMVNNDIVSWPPPTRTASVRRTPSPSSSAT